jgi:hypothetical protein
MGKTTFNTSLYLNKTTDAFQFARENQAICKWNSYHTFQLATMATTNIERVEFTLNYSPYKWWKLNGISISLEMKLKEILFMKLNNDTITKTF